ncbi:MAG: 1-deoxy-D-xylulose-5-phosphate reductoisomerase [Alphaproteobacteria bacterium]
MKKIAIFGSTGSIGTQTLDVIAQNKDDFTAHILVGGKNLELLVQQAKQFEPEYIICADKNDFAQLKEILPSHFKNRIAAGRQAVIDAAKIHVDMHIGAITGAAGLEPIFEAVKKSIPIGLANKEALVCAGSLLTENVKKYNSKILPVDSEHSAIFQCLEEDNKDMLDHIILTGSGGPFRKTPIHELKNVTVEQAIAHPNWSMGKKISVDSATMMNKSLEFIEACHLFNCNENQIQTVIHPKSIMHSAVAYKDGSIIAHLGKPDMRVPIAAALSWPKRIKTSVNILDLTDVGNLEFEKPDYERFPSLLLVRQAFNAGQGATIIFNAANEVAVDAFLNKQIPFTSIVTLVKNAVEMMDAPKIHSIEDVYQLDLEAREFCIKYLKKIKE